jgi:hypothetical protein
MFHVNHLFDRFHPNMNAFILTCNCEDFLFECFQYW